MRQSESKKEAHAADVAIRCLQFGSLEWELQGIWHSPAAALARADRATDPLQQQQQCTEVLALAHAQPVSIKLTVADRADQAEHQAKAMRLQHAHWQELAQLENQAWSSSWLALSATVELMLTA